MMDMWHDIVKQLQNRKICYNTYIIKKIVGFLLWHIQLNLKKKQLNLLIH